MSNQIVAYPIYDRNNQLVTQGALNALMCQLDALREQLAEARLVAIGKDGFHQAWTELQVNKEWNSALEWAASWIEGSVMDDERVIEFAFNMAMSIRASKRQPKESDEAQPCGGYYCSEEHGHIDCAPEKAI